MPEPSEATPGAAVAPARREDASGERRSEASTRGGPWHSMDQGSLMSGELLGGILIWGGAGALLDGWWGTGPWLFVVGALVGNGAGLWLVWRRSEGTPTTAPEGEGAHDASESVEHERPRGRRLRGRAGRGARG